VDNNSEAIPGRHEASEKKIAGREEQAKTGTEE
jgi:hypothetical protein